MTPANLKNPTKIVLQFTRWVSDLDWRILLLILPLLSVLLYVSLSSVSSAPSSVFNPFSSSLSPIQSIFNSRVPSPPKPREVEPPNSTQTSSAWRQPRKEELDRSRIAVCLVGGARRFELTGPSIIQKILKVYPNSDLFLHSPLDSNAYKFSLLKGAPRIASIKIFQQNRIPETESQSRVLTPRNSPNGIQGLLQYFHLVEGCLTIIQAHQLHHNFTYDWIVRTRVDGYWSRPLTPNYFVSGQYLVPPGSSYGGLNDRFGVGDYNTSVVALSRLSLIPQLDSAGFRLLNSECAFKAQLTTQNVSYTTLPLPFCVVTDRKYSFPPSRFGVPVASVSTPGPLSGAKCRPCTPVCSGTCVRTVMSRLDRGWSWTDWEHNSMELCDARGEWEEGWEKRFDEVAGEKLSAARRRISSSSLKQCIKDFEDLRRRTARWESPPPEEMCKLGLGSG